MNSVMLSFAQDQHNVLSKQSFETSMESYIIEYISDVDNLNRIKNAKGLYEEGQVPTSYDIKSILREEAKSRYIQDNRKDYRDLYFSQASAMVMTDTFVCDNGGFENGFDFYRAYTTRYSQGSDSCDLTYGGQPVIWTEENVLPVQNRFEIVNSGTDPVFGITKTKFGSKAIRINNRYGHVSQFDCDGDGGVDRLVKRFKVTEVNRDFTIWYAVAIENPGNTHINQQPFLNIKCDRAPNNELCFDADIIPCDENYSDPNCSYSGIDVLDWACHRFKIPAEFVDSIATLEIIVGDCGQSAHFGMAYIDGICEECEESSLGSVTLFEGDIENGVGINYSSCEGLNATVCGSYTAPTICGVWDSLVVSIDGYNIYNVQIDTSSKTFCFDFPISNFTTEDCIEFYVDVTFTSSVFQDLPTQYSNNIEICRSEYKTHDYAVQVSACYGNNTSTISDDYYYVELDLIDFVLDSWIIQRQLIDPYPNESGTYTIAEGTGNEVLILGPFLIQDGDWNLIIEVDDCIYDLTILAQDYCSGCDDFYGLDISNIQCQGNGNADDTWSFNINVLNTTSGLNENYNINGNTNNYNENVVIDNLLLNNGCQEFLLDSYIGTILHCSTTFTVCPPKPCDNEASCDLEVYVKEVLCTSYGNSFDVELDVDATFGQGQFLCYKTENVDFPGTGSTMQGTELPSQNIFGPFTESTFLTIYVCESPNTCSDCATTSRCYKTIYIPELECKDPRFRDRKGLIRNEPSISKFPFMVIPNPVKSDEFILKSDLDHTDFSIYDIRGKMVHIGNFIGKEHRVSLDIKSGIYFIRYLDTNKEPKVVKMIKL